MDNVDLQFLTRSFDRVCVELTEMRAELRNVGADIKVLTGIVLGLAREMEHVKDQFGRMDARISKVERLTGG